MLNQYDEDLDGYSSCDEDCDDLDGGINPGEDEFDNNEIDDDCDGDTDECADGMSRLKVQYDGTPGSTDLTLKLEYWDFFSSDPTIWMTDVTMLSDFDVVTSTHIITAESSVCVADDRWYASGSYYDPGTVTTYYTCQGSSPPFTTYGTVRAWLDEVEVETDYVNNYHSPSNVPGNGNGCEVMIETTPVAP